MALTDLLKGAGRVVQAAALGLAVYGCGGSDKAKEPTYEGMCDEYRQLWISCGEVINPGDENILQECFTQCEPTVYNIPGCAGVYCSIKLRVCDDVDFCSQAVYDCMQDFDSGKFQDDFCHDNDDIGFVGDSDS